jgi:MFS family permease
MTTKKSALQPISDKDWFSYENKSLMVLCLTFGVVFFDRNAINFLTPFIIADLSITPSQIGYLVGGLSATWAISGYIGGRVCDAIGRHKFILLIAVIAFSLSSFMSGLAAGFGVLLASRMLMGLAEGPVLPISQVIMVQASSPHRRGFNMGVVQQLGANVLGFFIAPIAVVALAEHFGWRQAFFLAGVPGLICALLIWRYIKDPARPEAQQQDTGVLSLKEMLAYRNIPLCMVISGLMIAMAVLMFVFYPLYITQVLKFSPEKMSYVMSVLGLSAVVSSLIVPGLSDRYGRKPVMIITMALALLMPLGVVYFSHSNLLLGAMLFIGFTASALAPLAMATVPAETVGGLRVTAVVGLVNGAGEIIGGMTLPVIGGQLAERYGYIAPVILQAVCIALTIILVAMLKETAPRIVAKRTARLN